MKPRELAVLDALNIASTIHRHGRRFQATAAQIAEVLRTDRRMIADHGAHAALPPQAVRTHLLRLETARSPGCPPLVQRVGTDGGQVLWALSAEGVGILNA